MTDNAARSSQTLSSREDGSPHTSTQQALNIIERYRQGTLTKAAALLAIQRDLAPIIEQWGRTIDEILPTYVLMLDEVDQGNQGAGLRGGNRRSTPSASTRESDWGQG